MIKIIEKLGIIVILQVNIEEQRIVFPVVFQNSSNYDYHFIIRELANEFEGQFECLEENTEKHKTFTVPIEKEITNIDKDFNENVVTIFYQKKKKKKKY